MPSTRGVKLLCPPLLAFVAAVQLVPATASTLPPPLGLSWPISGAFVFQSHFSFKDPHNETAKDLAITLMNEDLNHRFEIGEPGNLLLACELTVDDVRLGYSGVEVYPSAAAWTQHKTNSDPKLLATLGSLITQTQGHMVGPRDSLQGIMADIKAFNFTYKFAPIPTAVGRPVRYGVFENSKAEYPSSAIALVAHSVFNNASCEEPAMAINKHTVEEHIFEYQERGSTLLSYNCTQIEGGYKWIEIYVNQAAYNVHAKHSDMAEVTRLLGYAQLKTLAMYGPKESISNEMASLVTTYGGKVIYGPVPVSLVGNGRFGVFDGRTQQATPPTAEGWDYGGPPRGQRGGSDDDDSNEDAADSTSSEIIEEEVPVEEEW